MRWEFHPEALVEYQEAVDYYDSRDSRVALRFMEAVEDAISRIMERPLAWRVIDDQIRRCRTRGFPYGVLYAVESDSILIVAVMHGSREPGYWLRRLDQSCLANP